MIRAVIFDMYETLITHYRSPLYFSAQMAADAGIPVEAFLPHWRETDTPRTIGEMTLETVLEEILQRNACFSPELLQTIVRKRYATKEECFQTMHEEILPLLSKLKANGLKIGLISNCFSEEAEVIHHSVLTPYLDAMCLSYDLGVKKPDPEIFRICAERLVVSPEECLYVGDGGSDELNAAQKFGMNAVQAIWYLQERSEWQPETGVGAFPRAESPLAVLQYLEKGD